MQHRADPTGVHRFRHSQRRGEKEAALGLGIFHPQLREPQQFGKRFPLLTQLERAGLTRLAAISEIAFTDFKFRSAELAHDHQLFHTFQIACFLNLALAVVRKSETTRNPSEEPDLSGPSPTA